MKHVRWRDSLRYVKVAYGIEYIYIGTTDTANTKYRMRLIIWCCELYFDQWDQNQQFTWPQRWLICAQSVLCCDVHCTQWAMWQNHKYIHIQAEHRTGMLVMLRTMEAHDSSIEITHLLTDCVHYLLYNMYSSRHRMSVCVGFVQNWMFVFIFISKQKWNSSRFYNNDVSTNERETHTTKFYAKEKCHIWKPVCFCSNSLSVGKYLDWKERERKEK